MASAPDHPRCPATYVEANVPNMGLHRVTINIPRFLEI